MRTALLPQTKVKPVLDYNNSRFGYIRLPGVAELCCIKKQIETK